MPARFTQVDDNLFRGGAPELDEIPILKDVWGIKKIVSLDGQSGKRIHDTCKSLGLEHKIIPLRGGDDPKFNSIPEEVISWDDGPVYVHCWHGKDRTGVVCAIYRVLVDGWDKNDAIAEAATFGMGWHLPKESRREYYKAINRSLENFKKDNNSVSDIVSEQRGSLQEVQPYPSPTSFNPLSSGFSSDPVLPGQQSFAPFLDVEQDHLNRPASRIDKLKRLAAPKIYRFCGLDEVLRRDVLWTNSPHSALELGQKQFNQSNLQQNNKNIFSAYIANTAKIISYPQEPAKPLVQAAMLNDADVVHFRDINGREYYYIIDPAVIMDVKSMTLDKNDAPLVGLHDNYDGSASFVFPGSGNGMVPGLAGGAGGFAGFVQVPSQQF